MLVPTSVCKMSHTTTDSIDGLFCKDQAGSPLMDECNSGGLILKKGPWTPGEDAILVDYVKKHGEGNWNAVQKHSGLFRCGKSCRLRWANHLRPNLKKGAFTQEEERLIVELHAKMGNKWARLAAHLPGRTDNEIKNYWNTRIKRRQRAGLPLYPPGMYLQESKHTGGNGGHHMLLQSDRYEVAEVTFEANQGVLPYVSSSSLLMNHIASPQYSTFGHRQKRLRDSTSIISDYRNGFPPSHHRQDDKSAHSCGLPFQVDSNNNNPLSFGVIEGGQSLSNGNFSASKPTSEEAVKLELPSLQYSETALSSWGVSYSPAPLLDSVDTFIQSPPSVTPRNSGLLDALLHEAKTLGSAKIHSSEKSKSSNSSSATSGDENLTERKDYGDPISPLGHSATSLFSDISATGSSLDEQPLNGYTGCNMKSEPGDVTWPSGRQNEISTRLGFTRPDTLLAFDWFDQSVRDQSIMSDAIASLLSDDLGSEYNHLAMGNSNEGQGLGFGSCAWNNMPPVCQMSEIP